MKNLISLLLLSSSLFLTSAITPQGEDALRQYVRALEGTWITMPEYQIADQVDRPDLLIHIDEALIENGQVKIVVSEYCGEFQADYLHFALQGEKLRYVGASKEGCFFDMSQLDFAYLGFEVNGKDTLLTYESQETEYANYQYHRLLRMPLKGTAEGWACRLQGYLTTFLQEGSYQICNPHGEGLSLTEAFGSEEVVAEMAFFNDSPVLLPMLEELGVSTSFDIVLIGEVHPGGKSQIYAIEWLPQAIYLYETYTEYDQLVKGSLRYVLRPDFVKAHHTQQEGL